MKPKTIDDVLNQVNNDTGEPYLESYLKQFKDQLIDLFMSCVPEKQRAHTYASENADIYILQDEWFKKCRDQMIKNLEKLK